MVLHWAATRQVLLMVEQQYSVPEKKTQIYIRIVVDLKGLIPAPASKIFKSKLKWSDLGEQGLWATLGSFPSSARLLLVSCLQPYFVVTFRTHKIKGKYVTQGSSV